MDHAVLVPDHLTLNVLIVATKHPESITLTDNVFTHVETIIMLIQLELVNHVTMIVKHAKEAQLMTVLLVIPTQRNTYGRKLV